MPPAAAVGSSWIDQDLVGNSTQYVADGKGAIMQAVLCTCHTTPEQLSSYSVEAPLWL